MTKFLSIKTHYDHRKNLPSYLKFSKAASESEYNEYLELFDEGVGGQGFHECLNFAIPEEGGVKIYLPPTCLPAKNLVEEEFLIFSFTYKGDKELPSVVLGVHGGVSINSLHGISRTDYQIEGSTEVLRYHATAQNHLTTLFTSPLPYDFKEGIYTPVYKNWGYGKRYSEAQHAEKIIRSAYDLATVKLPTAHKVEQQVIEREIYVLENIFSRYFSGSLEVNGKKRSGLTTPVTGIDKEIGYRGELEVYNRELDYVKALGLTPDYVEWLSQGAPTSVYDIKSVRKVGADLLDHFIEVKSSKLGLGENVYVSSRQVAFFKENPKSSSIAFVNFDSDKTSITFKSFDEVTSEFELTPIKYKLSAK